LIFIIFCLLSYGLLDFLASQVGAIISIILWERVVFLLIGISVFFSGIPVYFAKKRLYAAALEIVRSTENMTVIGITGSFGKSSTKAILVHLLRSKFGEKQVLFTPENENNEVAIARLVIRNKEFFSSDVNKRKFLIVEIGAYAPGEIRTVCEFVLPKIGIITGINSQHISLFGSQEKIEKAKFELAESVQKKVFFNADSKLLAKVFADRKIIAAPIPISVSSVAKNIQVYPEKTTFEIYGQKMTLPWAGGFFTGNAILAMEVARECGITPTQLFHNLPKLPPLTKALTVEKNKKGVFILKDLYSSNPDGVLAAINHLKQFKGKKVFVGIPLLELGKKSKVVHEQIFEALRDIEAEVFWWKNDFRTLGKEICGKKFHGKVLKKLKTTIDRLREGDAVLFESRLPKGAINQCTLSRIGLKTVYYA